MSSVLKRSLPAVLALLVLFGCSKNYDQPPAQISFISSLDLDDVQRGKVLDELLEESDNRLRAWGNLVRARDLITESDFLESLEYIEEAEYLFRDLKKDTQGLARAMYFKAHVYWSLGAVSEGVLSFSDEAVRLVNTERWPTYAGNRSTYLLELGRYEETIALSDTLLPIYKANGSNLAEAYAVRLAALNALNRAPSQLDSLVDLIWSASLDQTVALDRKHVYERLIDLGYLSKERLLVALDFAVANDFVALEAEIRDALPLEAIEGVSIEEARSARRIAYQRSNQQSKAFSQEFLQYELDRGVRSAQRQREQAQLREFTFIFILISLFVAGAGALLILQNRGQVKRARVSEQDAKLLLDSYKNKIRPHFLFNQLNNVSGFLSQDKVIDAQEYIGLLSVHLRALLEADKQQKTTLGQEFDRVENYVGLQQLSSYPDVEVRVNCDDLVRFQRVPSGFLQTLVENSYKYAANARQEGAYIAIRSYKEGKSLVLEVEDSGYGFLERTPGTGSGLSLIEERIEFDRANSKTPGLWGISTDFGKRKSTVKITMPFQHD